MSKLIRSIWVLAFAGWAGSVSAGPITGADIVTVDGTDWAQVDLFTDLSWNDINTVCPGGVCGAGTLNGYDMSGWEWASVSDLNSLFNGYLSAQGVSGEDLLGPAGYDSYDSYDPALTSDWGLDFFADGWRNLSIDGSLLTIGGWSSDVEAGASIFKAFGFLSWGTSDLSGEQVDYAQVGTDAKSAANNLQSAWFYKTEVPQTGVPAPTTLALFGLGLAGLGWTRRKKA